MNMTSMMPSLTGGGMNGLTGTMNTSLMGLPGDMSSMTSEAGSMMGQYGLTGGMDGTSNIYQMMQQMLGGGNTLEQQMKSYMNQILAQYGSGSGSGAANTSPAAGSLGSLSSLTTEQQMSSYFNQIMAQYGTGSTNTGTLNNALMAQFDNDITQIMAQYGLSRA